MVGVGLGLDQLEAKAPHLVPSMPHSIAHPWDAAQAALELKRVTNARAVAKLKVAFAKIMRGEAAMRLYLWSSRLADQVARLLPADPPHHTQNLNPPTPEGGSAGGGTVATG